MKKSLIILILIFLATKTLALEVNDSYFSANYNFDNSPHNYNNSLNNPKALIFYSTKNKPKGYIVKKGETLIVFDLKGHYKGYIKERDYSIPLTSHPINCPMTLQTHPLFEGNVF